MRFTGLSIDDRIPDAKTIWLFRDKLVKAGAEKKLFDLFHAKLEDARLITRAGSIVDATFVDIPRQRNSRKENAEVKEDRMLEAWEAEGSEDKLRQKDVDARWTKKRDELHFGYKDHLKADADSKLIDDYIVTDASVHDSRALPSLVNKKDSVLYADSAYTGRELLSSLPSNIVLQINKKGYRNHPITEEQKASNREKSRTRSRVEHIFLS